MDRAVEEEGRSSSARERRSGSVVGSERRECSSVWEVRADS